MLTINLPQLNAKINCGENITINEIFKKEAPDLLKKSAAARIDGENLTELNSLVNKDCSIELIPFNSEEGLDILRHSTAHVMASAVQELFPDTLLAIGPAIETGFYYDFKRSFTPEDLQAIEKQMKKIIKQNQPFLRKEVSKEEAVKLFAEKGEKFKLELLEAIPDDMVSLYWHGNFVDLCRGPHLSSTGKIPAYKLLSIAGAYWRGDEKREMLSRLYGTSFASQEELDSYLKQMEEAAKRDHRKVGKELELFTFYEEAGPGLVFYHPKGALLKTLVEDFTRKEHLRRGYQFVITPHIFKSDLWHTSGHYENYAEHMFLLKTAEDQEYVLKPMNCPGHILIFKSKKHSYRDLPMRFFELGTVYRNEKSGVLHGLLRVRGFTQDDAHIFCTPDQMESEILGVINFAVFMLKTFGFQEYDFRLSTRPEKSIGTDENWENATNALRMAMENNNISYKVDEGGGAFYGPKIDVHVKDAIGRYWQCATIQLDFNLAGRFDLNYIGPDGKEHPVIMIHRVVLAGIERFLGVLIEHYGGAFPLWLAPEQVRILPITEKHHEYAEKIKNILWDNDFRVTVDLRSEKTGYKIRAAQNEKIPYMVIVGDKEVENNTLSLRSRNKGELGSVALEDFIAQLKKEIEEKA